MIENWRRVVGYEGLYECSDQGRIKRLGNTKKRKDRILKPVLGKRGYLQVGLSKNGKVTLKIAHRLVMETFYGKCPTGMEGCHNNGIRIDNRLDNLRYDTRKNNIADKILHGTDDRGEKSSRAILSEMQVITVIKMIKVGFTDIQIAKCFPIVRKGIINDIRHNKRWKHISRNQPITSHINPNDFVKVA